jgi:hypothetical protein
MDFLQFKHQRKKIQLVQTTAGMVKPWYRICMKRRCEKSLVHSNEVFSASEVEEVSKT